jgi:nicotinamidase/pyrazinamidase
MSASRRNYGSKGQPINNSISSVKFARTRVSMLLVDPQKDFHEGGTLPVTGATADAVRVAKLLRAKMAAMCKIFVTLDSHYKTHIAHGISWVDKDGNHPNPFTIISGDDAANEVWRAADPSREDTFKKYAADLESGGKFKVCIWPEHCLIGTEGHTVQRDINAAIQEWTAFSGTAVEYVHKGQNLDTEMYSAMAAEVPVADDPRTQFNHALMKLLNDCDTLIIAGEALSHCVNFTARDILSHWVGDKRRIVVLTDCSSPVGGFQQAAEEFIEFCRREGAQVMDSESLLTNWDWVCKQRQAFDNQLPMQMDTSNSQQASDKASQVEAKGCGHNLETLGWRKAFLLVAGIVIFFLMASGQTSTLVRKPATQVFANKAAASHVPASAVESFSNFRSLS